MSNHWYLKHALVKDVFRNNTTLYERVARLDLSVYDIAPRVLSYGNIVKILALGVLAYREEQHNIIRFLCRKDPRCRKRFEKFVKE